MSEKIEATTSPPLENSSHNPLGSDEHTVIQTEQHSNQTNLTNVQLVSVETTGGSSTGSSSHPFGSKEQTVIRVEQQHLDHSESKLKNLNHLSPLLLTTINNYYLTMEYYKKIEENMNYNYTTDLFKSIIEEYESNQVVIESITNATNKRDQLIETWKKTNAPINNEVNCKLDYFIEMLTTELDFLRKRIQYTKYDL